MERTGENKLKVLLVDDEERVLGALRRSLSKLTSNVEFDTAQGGKEAINKSSAYPFDLVISDLRMPNIDGEKVLGFLRRQQPDSVRVVLSGQASAEKLLDTLRVSHQYLEKPCPTARLATVLDSLATLKRSNLPQILIKHVVTMTSLPCDGTLVSLVREQLSQGAEFSVNDALIAADIGMSIGLLRLIAITSGGVISPQVTISAQGIPSSLLTRFFDSLLISPLYENDELLRAVRVTSIKANILRQQLSRRGIANAHLLSLVGYLGELTLINSVGGELEMLAKLQGCRDEITQLVWALWAFPRATLDSLKDKRFLASRQEIDSFFPLNELSFLSDNEIVEIFSEIICLTE